MLRRAMVGWLVLAVAACSPALDSRQPRQTPRAGPTTTADDSSTLTLVEVSGDEALTPAAEQYAEKHGISVEAAREALLAQAEIVEVAMFLRNNIPGFAGFKVVHEPPEVYGVVAVTDPAQVTLLGHPEIRVVKARVAESEFLEYDARLRDALADEGFPDIVAVMYAPFEDEFIVWLHAPVDEQEQSHLDRMREVVLEDLGSQFAGVGIRFDQAGSIGG